MMPIKIQCGCGQRYAFDTEPVCGRMPARVACPICGEDGTNAANEAIAFTITAELVNRKSHRDNVMIFAVVGCMMAGLVGIFKAVDMKEGMDVLLCLLGAIGAFGTALCVYFWKR
jgi:hypothetical protein